MKNSQMPMVSLEDIGKYKPCASGFATLKRQLGHLYNKHGDELAREEFPIVDVINTNGIMDFVWLMLNVKHDSFMLAKDLPLILLHHGRRKFEDTDDVCDDLYCLMRATRAMFAATVKADVRLARHIYHVEKQITGIYNEHISRLGEGLTDVEYKDKIYLSSLMACIGSICALVGRWKERRDVLSYYIQTALSRISAHAYQHIGGKLAFQDAVTNYYSEAMA